MKNKLLFSLMLVCVALFAYHGATFGGITGKVAGVITDAASGEPLPAVNVVIEGTTLGGATDNEGHYFIINIPPGTYTLQASMVGYAIESKTGVLVNVDHTTPIDFDLRVTAIAGEEVTVTAEREIVPMDISASQIVADVEQIAEVPLITDIAQYIHLQAGIQGDYIRGGGLDQTEFMVDGLLAVNNRSNQPMMMVNLSAVRELNIIKGGFNAEYGNVRSGMINVITKEGSPSVYHGSLDYRYSPAHYKHKGPNLFSPENYQLKAYFDPAVCWVGTMNGTWDDETKRQNLEFLGWNRYSQDLLLDDDPNNDMTPEQAQQRFIWLHRSEGSDALMPTNYKEVTGRDHHEGKYGNKPDWVVDASYGGPVPVIGKYLGDLSFFVSYRNNWEAFGLPTYRDYYKEMNTNFKLTSRITSSMKLTFEGAYGAVYSISSSSNTGQSGYLSSGTSIFGAIGTEHLYYPASRCPWDVWQGMQGIAFDHVLSPSTFYNIRISHVYEKNHCAHNVEMRKALYDPIHGLEGDKEYVVRYFGSQAQDEAPYGAVRVEGGYMIMVDNMYYGAHSAGAINLSGVHTTNFKFDITSQVDRYNQIKAGFLFVYDDINTHWEHVRWESMADNISEQWAHFPYRMGAYVQDKLEFEGMIANFGLRIDYNQPNTEWYDLESDRYNKYLKKEYKGAFTEVMPRKMAEGHLKISPRLGVSHPISENAKLYFNYGHFYSMPTSTSMYNIRYGNLQQGVTFVGNPSAELPKTTSYELGIEYNFSNLFLIHLAGYYKDVVDQTSSISYQNWDNTISYSTTANQNYADIRGFELRIDKRFGRWITGWLNYNYMVQSSGNFGRQQYYEDPRMQILYGLYNPEQSRPLARPVFRANLNVRTPRNWGPGPTIGQAKIIGDIQIAFLYTWQAGSYSTWDPLVTGELLNNVQWKDSWNIDGRFNKRLQFGKYSVSIFADIQNILDHERLNTMGFSSDEDRRRYMESLHLEMYNGEEYKQAGFIGGNDRLGDIKSEDKPYIDMPNRTHFTFFNPRTIFWGIRVDF